MTRRRTAALAALVLSAAVLTPSAGASAPTVTMSGTAYEFNKVHTMLSGATIHVLEDPALTATVGEDGTYELEVPDQAAVTPYITKDGYGTIYLQTFSTDGEDLVNVNFQTPTLEVMGLLALVLGIEKNDAGYPAQCVVVSTVSTKQVRGVSYEQFIGWGAHGVAGVTASISPEAGRRTYFNESVIPDSTVTETSKDGGVVWTELPPGEYTLSAQGAGSTWPDVHVTCADGRIVNANPPWGLNQEATTVRTKVSATWGGRRTPVLTGLRLAKVPHQELSEYAAEHDSTIDYRGVVTVSCSGTGCFEPVSTHGSMKKSVDLLPLLGSSARKLKPGQTLTVRLAVPGFDTRIDSWLIPKRGVPTKTTTCVPLGWSAERTTC